MDFPAQDQTHSFDATVYVWNSDSTINYGMKLKIENVDSCCEEHAKSSAALVGFAIKDKMQEVWGPTFNYRVTEVVQRW